MKIRVYVASSWRNPKQQEVVKSLLEAGYDVYDFRNPSQGNYGFYSWEKIDPNWQRWTPAQFRDILNHQLCKEAFALDYKAMRRADVCVLVLPCNRSAHLEAGWFAGQRKRLVVLLDGSFEPELTYKMADYVCLDLPELHNALESMTSWIHRKNEESTL